MLSRRITTTRPLLRRVLESSRRLPIIQQRCISQADIDDPNMNGGWVNPPRIKRQFRDPYGDWWDPQERRNYGEPIHEDDMDLAMFSPYEYTHITLKQGAYMWLCTLVVAGAFIQIMAFFYPNVEKPSYPKEYEGGLERELGGPKAVRARMAGDSYTGGSDDR